MGSERMCATFYIYLHQHGATRARKCGDPFLWLSLSFWQGTLFCHFLFRCVLFSCFSWLHFVKDLQCSGRRGCQPPGGPSSPARCVRGELGLPVRTTAPPCHVEVAPSSGLTRIRAVPTYQGRPLSLNFWPFVFIRPIDIVIEMRGQSAWTYFLAMKGPFFAVLIEYRGRVGWGAIPVRHNPPTY